MNKTLHRIAAAALALLAGAAQAQVANGSFDAGLDGWNPLGDTIVAGGVLTLTSAYAGDDDAPYNLSGNSALAIDVLEAAAGVAPYALDPAGEAAYEGSLVSQSFAVAAGDTLSFTWSFATHENLFLDHAFVVIDGTVITLATSAAPGSGGLFSHAFAQAGSATLALGVLDSGDFNGVSSLAIDNVVLTPVPEPGRMALLAAGLLVVARVMRRAKGKSAQAEA